MNTDTAARFWTVYEEKLTANMARNPGDYLPGIDAPTIAARLRAAVERSGQIGSINIDSATFR